MKNSRDLILGEVVNIFIIYHIPYSSLYSVSNGYDFQIFDHDILSVDQFVTLLEFTDKNMFLWDQRKEAY